MTIIIYVASAIAAASCCAASNSFLYSVTFLLYFRRCREFVYDTMCLCCPSLRAWYVQTTAVTPACLFFSRGGYTRCFLITVRFIWIGDIERGWGVQIKRCQQEPSNFILFPATGCPVLVAFSHVCVLTCRPHVCVPHMAFIQGNQNELVSTTFPPLCIRPHPCGMRSIYQSAFRTEEAALLLCVGAAAAKTAAAAAAAA